MTDRELMQMALNALEEYTDIVQTDVDSEGSCESIDCSEPARNAIKALRERLLLPDLNSTVEIAEVMEKIGWLKKKEWVGLTEEEAWGMLEQMSLGASVEDIRFIEAKLKERNSG